MENRTFLRCDRKSTTWFVTLVFIFELHRCIFFSRGQRETAENQPQQHSKPMFKTSFFKINDDMDSRKACQSTVEAHKETFEHRLKLLNFVNDMNNWTSLQENRLCSNASVTIHLKDLYMDTDTLEAIKWHYFVRDCLSMALLQRKARSVTWQQYGIKRKSGWCRSLRAMPFPNCVVQFISLPQQYYRLVIV